MTFNLRRWVALAGLATLLACGGGGGGSDNAPTGVQVPQGTRTGAATAASNISEANAASFAGPLARAVLSAGDANVPGISSGRDTPQLRRGRLVAQGQRWLRLALGALSWPRAYDFDISCASDNSGGSFDMNGNFVIGGAGYAMTSTTFAFNAGSPPTSGSVTLRDFLGNTVTLRARGDTFDIEFRPFGAPFPLIIPGLLWSAQRLALG